MNVCSEAFGKVMPNVSCLQTVVVVLSTCHACIRFSAQKTKSNRKKQLQWRRIWGIINNENNYMCDPKCMPSSRLRRITLKQHPSWLKTATSQPCSHAAIHFKYISQKWILRFGCSGRFVRTRNYFSWRSLKFREVRGHSQNIRKGETLNITSLV